MVLFRAVDIGADLYAMAAACVRAQMLAQRGRAEALDLADVFCRNARLRIRQNFATLHGPADVATYRLARQVLEGTHEWLEEGVIPVAQLAREAGAESTPRTRGATPAGGVPAGVGD
jgi:hypothetical protein